MTQAAEPRLGSPFKQWCLWRESLSDEAQKTVEVLLEKAGTSDCEQASVNLSSRTELNLYGNQIKDVTPLSGLTNLTELNLGENQIKNVNPISGLTNLNSLSLSENQIKDISPLSELTNLNSLFLENNPIAQQTCPVSPPSVCDYCLCSSLSGKYLIICLSVFTRRRIKG